MLADRDARHAAIEQIITLQPPFAVGDVGDVLHVLRSNLLVLALHAMACVAGFIAGSSLPLQAEHHTALSRWVHEHGGRIAIAFVVCATTFSLSAQAYLIGHTLAGVAGLPAASRPALLLLGVLPHAIPELIALFLPLAAWIIASRRGEWEQLLAATVRDGRDRRSRCWSLAAFIEVYVSPHLFTRAHPHPPADRAQLRRLARHRPLSACVEVRPPRPLELTASRSGAGALGARSSASKLSARSGSSTSISTSATATATPITMRAG